MEENKAILAELFQRIKKATSTTPYSGILGENAIADEFHPTGVNYDVTFVETPEGQERVASTTLVLEYDVENPNWHIAGVTNS